MPLSEGTIRQATPWKPRYDFRYQATAGSSNRLSRLFRASCFSAAIVLGCAGAVPAQQPASGQDHPDARPDAPSATPRADSSGKQEPHPAFYNVLAKRSIFFPDIADTPRALTPKEKFELFLSDSIAPNQVFTSVVGSAIAQADNSPAGWGQGWDAYGKRFGSSMARGASSEFFGTFLLASVLRQDPRFFPEANPTFGSSIKYSLSRVVITRNDAGTNEGNWSGLLGPLMAEGLANVYWPDQDRNAGQTLQRYGLDLALRAGGNMLRNYWPVFQKRLRHSNSHPPASQK